MPHTVQPVVCRLKFIRVSTYDVAELQQHTIQIKASTLAISAAAIM
jgi:hypothetical protein